MNLAETILTQKISERIKLINSQCNRKYDSKIDIISFNLTPRQFSVIKNNFALKETQVLCKDNEITPFEWDDFFITVNYNSRMNIYELRAKHSDYIDDFEEREDYFDSNY